MAIYHLTAATGTIRGGQSGAAKHDYVAREGDYAKREDKLMHAESAHMPAWAKADARAYWEAADTHERANGRLFKYVEFALPRELTLEQNIALSREFAMQLTKGIDGGNLPFTLGVHEGKGHNPHCHLIISERVNDGIERGPDVWFKRVATGKNAKPENGGARKSAALKRNEWLEDTRARWARVANEALAAAGHDARIDHRTLTAQRDEALATGDHERAKQLDRAPGEHMGPKAKAFEARTGKKSRRRMHAEERRRKASASRNRVYSLTNTVTNVRRQLRDDVSQLRELRAELARERNEAKANRTLLSRLLMSSRDFTNGVPRWARESVEQLEALAKALMRMQDEIEYQREREAPSPSPAPAGASRSPVAPVARQPSATQSEVAPARAGQRPASAGQDSSGDDRRKKLERQMNRALETGKSLHIGLAAAAELGERKAVDKLIENGAAVLPASLDAAAKRGDDDMFKKLVGAEGTATNHVALRELSQLCSSTEAQQKLEALAKQAKAQGGHVEGLGIDGPPRPAGSGLKAGAGVTAPK